MTGLEVAVLLVGLALLLLGCVRRRPTSSPAPSPPPPDKGERMPEREAA